MRTALEAVLEAMVTGGWANEADGNVASPYGHFARVSNSKAELNEIIDAFEEVIHTYDLVDMYELIGHFLVRTDSNGNVSITAYDNPIALTRDFQQLQDEFAEWNKD